MFDRIQESTQETVCLRPKGRFTDQKWIWTEAWMEKNRFSDAKSQKQIVFRFTSTRNH